MPEGGMRTPGGRPERWVLEGMARALPDLFDERRAVLEVDHVGPRAAPAYSYLLPTTGR